MTDHDIRGTHPLYLIIGLAVLALGLVSYPPVAAVLAVLEALS